MKHIQPSRLFGIVEGRIEFDDNDRKHLERSEDCQQVLTVFESYVAEDKLKRKAEAFRPPSMKRLCRTRMVRRTSGDCAG